MLNVLRHHGKDQPSSSLQDRGSCKGAQRLTASRQGSESSWWSRMVSRIWCSTPYGITARIRSAAIESRAFQPACSTPYGITARISCAQAAACSRVTSAQRLTASRQGSVRIVLENSSAHLLCSTPYGITARIRTGGGAPRLAKSAVCSTPYGITARIRQDLAKWQKLPLPCSTPYGITARIRDFGDEDASDQLACSTPYGITARVSNHNRKQTPSQIAVLNALRHHGKDQATV